RLLVMLPEEHRDVILHALLARRRARARQIRGVDRVPLRRRALGDAIPLLAIPHTLRRAEPRDERPDRVAVRGERRPHVGATFEIWKYRTGISDLGERERRLADAEAERRV